LDIKSTNMRSITGEVWTVLQVSSKTTIRRAKTWLKAVNNK
jgi:hypothetical protein